MEHTFANLTEDQLKEVTNLEGKLGVTLIAYNPSINEFKEESNHEKSIDSASI